MGSKMTPTWITLRKVGENKLVQSAYAWTIIVPIFAKLLAGLDDVVRLTIFGHEFSLNWGLPFSWKVLFLVALVFMLANLVYEAFCPELIKQTASHRDFSVQQRSASELQQLLAKSMERGIVDLDSAVKWQNWLNGRMATLMHSQNNVAYNPTNEDRLFPDLYAFVTVAAARAHPVARLTAAILYFLGFCGLGYLIWENFRFVLEHW
jgi:hypothetical protein